jgi:hypothetical protein
MSGRVVHFEIPYEDGDRARAFYTRVFGWELNEMPEMDYTLATSGPSSDEGPTEPGFINGGMMQRGQPFTAPTVVIDVESIDDALKSIVGAGGAMISERQPVGGLGFAAYFTDTEGNVIGLWESVPQG